MASISLVGLSKSQIEELVNALNSDEILHARNGDILRVAEDDAEAVHIAVAVLRNHNKSQSLGQQSKSSSQSDTVRYDVTEMESLARIAMFRQLDREQIAFSLESGIVTADIAAESRIDEIIRDAELAVKDLEESQELAREISRGDRSPACEACGDRPAAEIDLRRQVGMVVIMRSYRAQATLCDRCADQAYKQFQRSTALKGWTGVRSALMNPVVLGVNAFNRNKHRRSLSD